MLTLIGLQLLVAFLWVMTELILGSWGIVFPGFLLYTFYLAVSFNARKGLLGGLVTGAIVEVIFGRQFSAFPLVLLTLLYADVWRRTFDRRYLSYQFMSGALIGGVYYLYLAAIEHHLLALASVRVLWEHLPGAIANLTVSAAVFPVLLIGVDHVAAAIGSPQFRAKQRVSYRHEDD